MRYELSQAFPDVPFASPELEARTQIIADIERAKCGGVDVSFEQIDGEVSRSLISAEQGFVIRLPLLPNRVSFFRQSHSTAVLDRLWTYAEQHNWHTGTDLEFSEVLDEHLLDEKDLGGRYLQAYDLPNAGYTVLSHVKGNTLTESTIRQFTDKEKAEIGRSVGRFVAFMASALPAHDYPSGGYSLLQTALSTAVIFDRERFLNQVLHESIPGDAIYDSLRRSMAELEYDYRAQPYRKLHNCVIHDDLSVNNLTINGDHVVGQETVVGNHAVQGVIDFDNTLIGSPARALRYLAMLGESAVLGGAEAFEAAAGEPVDVSQLYMWARAQTLTLCTVRARLGKQIYDEDVDRLQLLIPDEDWSGIAEHNARIAENATEATA